MAKVAGSALVRGSPRPLMEALATCAPANQSRSRSEARRAHVSGVFGDAALLTGQCSRQVTVPATREE